jgi:hypothetical protein
MGDAGRIGPDHWPGDNGKKRLDLAAAPSVNGHVKSGSAAMGVRLRSSNPGIPSGAMAHGKRCRGGRIPAAKPGVRGREA